MPQAPRDPLSNGFKIIGAHVRPPARFWGRDYADSDEGKAWDAGEHVFEVFAYHPFSRENDECWSFRDDDGEQHDITRLWMRKFLNEGRLSGEVHLFFVYV
jgi:hypothetical protein